ncbi:MAG: response regulator transcription factor [Cyclobacteriaceae bacterium]
MAKYKLLIVEDDPNLGDILREYLELKGYNTTLCADGEEGSKAFQQDVYDLCILDIMMPKKDGFTLAREIRVSDKNVPIVFLTAKSMKEDTIEGFRIGADDYLTKPFSMEELLMRLKAILRRTTSNNQNDDLIEFDFGKFHFESDKQLLKIDGNEVKLTTKESELLKILCQNMGSVVDRRVALKKIWHDDSYFNARSMDVYITKLRKHLKADENIKILTIHGQGFKLVQMN